MVTEKLVRFVCYFLFVCLFVQKTLLFIFNMFDKKNLFTYFITFGYKWL